MKAELNIHNRLIFYAQYLFQEVVELPTLVWTGNPPEPSHDEWSMSMFEPDMLRKIVDAQFPLILRNIRSLSEDELQIVHGLSGYGSLKQDQIPGFRYEMETDSAMLELESWDYLRSISVAIPFRGNSVESLVSAGWVKLIERTDKPE